MQQRENIRIRHSATALCALLLVSPFLPERVAAQDAAVLGRAREHARAAAAAQRSQEWSAQESELNAALAIQPRHPIWLLSLAGASARRGHVERALAVLDTLARFGYTFNLSRNDAFGVLRNHPAFRELERRFAANADRIGDSPAVLALPGPDFLPEGVAFDARDNSYYISSVHQRRIVRVRDGETRVFADSSAGLWAVLAIALAPRARSLWAVTTVMPQMRGYTSGQSGTALVELDIGTGAVLRRIEPQGDGHTFNDLTVADSAVFVSDAHGAIYRWTEHDGLVELVPHGTLLNPSGIVVMPDHESLYVADYPVGLAHVSLRTGETVRVGEAAGISTYGIDGLYRHGRDLIAIQNALQPHRVVRLSLDTTGGLVHTLTVLERAHPAYDEPTLGVVIDDALLYVANSRWQKFRDTAYTGAADLSGPVILRLPLGRR